MIEMGYVLIFLLGVAIGMLIGMFINIGCGKQRIYELTEERNKFINMCRVKHEREGALYEEREVLLDEISALKRKFLIKRQNLIVGGKSVLKRSPSNAEPNHKNGACAD